MLEQAFAEVNFEMYDRWLVHSTGHRSPFAACKPDGTVVWENSHGLEAPIDTLIACQAVIGNSLFHRWMQSIEKQVREGKGIAAGFGEAPFVPPMVKQVITTGEETGNLAKVMGRIADFYDRELTKRITTLAKLAEPIMLLIMGAVVGLIVSSLILPIFKLSRAVHQQLASHS